MAVATFDTLKFANTLKAAGVPPQQAEAQAVAFAEVIQLNFKELVTKEDLAAEAKDLKREVKELEQRLGARIDASIAKVENSITQLRGENVLIRWMLGLVITGIVGILIRVLFYAGV